MIVVKVAGGLGNQMFNYAFAKFLQKRGHKVVVDVSFVVKNANPVSLCFASMDFQRATSCIKNSIILHLSL